MNNNREVPVINVGILSTKEISFTFNGIFRDNIGDNTFEDRWEATCDHNKIILKKESGEHITENGVVFSPMSGSNSFFTIHNVIIGLNFHWQRSEDQSFKGDLKLIIENGKITAVNVISLEEYLKSVISSEMSATSSVELLKAHSVISRGWQIAQSEKRNSGNKLKRQYLTETRTENEVVKWYDREDHQNFDVCADDHCQRYQGITRAATAKIEKIVEETFGEVLIYNGEVCDTRYYKCCGGITELFENVWEPVNHPYLQKVTDQTGLPPGLETDLTDNSEAQKWILGSPDSFCNTTDKKILKQVLNDYDLETPDFFRWKVIYTQEKLSELVKAKTGIDFGLISDIKPVERGVSGRIIRLEITGNRKKMIIGKELEIRKALSESHLSSSCFFVEKTEDNMGVSFIIHGAGWGHGVGLCQIGAAVMATKGFTYREILDHYFPGSVLEKRY